MDYGRREWDPAQVFLRPNILALQTRSGLRFLSLGLLIRDYTSDAISLRQLTIDTPSTLPLSGNPNAFSHDESLINEKGIANVLERSPRSKYLASVIVVRMFNNRLR